MRRWQQAYSTRRIINIGEGIKSLFAIAAEGIAITDATDGSRFYKRIKSERYVNANKH